MHPCGRYLRVIFILSKKVAFSIVTFSQINSALIPEFDPVLKELEANMTEIEKKNQQECATEEKSIFEKYRFLVEAKIRWTSFLEDYASKSKGIMQQENSISHWFQSNHDEDIFDGEKHWHGLVPKYLTNRK